MIPTDLQGMTPTEWLNVNRGEVATLIKVMLCNYHPSSTIVDDLTQTAIHHLITYKVLERWDPKKSSLRYYLYLVIMRIVMDYKASKSKRLPKNRGQEFVEWMHGSDNPYPEVDAQIDNERWLEHVRLECSRNSARVAGLLQCGYIQSEVAVFMDVSAMRVSQIVRTLREHYEEWVGRETLCGR